MEGKMYRLVTKVHYSKKYLKQSEFLSRRKWKNVKYIQKDVNGMIPLIQSFKICKAILCKIYEYLGLQQTYYVDDKH